MIKIENLCKKYGDTEILKDFNLTVPKGSVYGLMGLNGAGKTTVIKHLAGFAEPDRGTVTIDGQSIIDNEDLKAVSYTHLSITSSSMSMPLVVRVKRKFLWQGPS